MHAIFQTLMAACTWSCSRPLDASTLLLAIDKGLALEIRELAAGGFDDDGAGTYVEDVHVRFHDGIDATRSEQVVMQEITITSNAAEAADQSPERGPARTRGQRLQVARGQRGRFDRVDRAHAIGCSLSQAPTPISPYASSP